MKVLIKFHYSESCNNVYKKTQYFINDKKVTARRKEIQEIIEDAPEILTANTYFWNPGRGSAQRRNNEQKRNEEVEQWGKEQGFSIKEEGDFLILEKEIKK